MSRRKRDEFSDDEFQEDKRTKLKSDDHSEGLVADSEDLVDISSGSSSSSSSDEDSDLFVYSGDNAPGAAIRQTMQRVHFKLGVEEIGDGAFRNCSSLLRVSIPSSVERIGKAAFQRCEELVNLFLEEGLLTIRSRAFENCSSLQNVRFPSSLGVIEDFAFMSCSNLGRVVLQEGLREIGKHAFSSCTVLSEIKIPSTVEVLGEYCFRECVVLSEVHLMEGLKAIAKGTFFRCTSLFNIKIVSTVETIGDYAFAECPSLGILELPEKLKQIGDHAFAKCDSQPNVTFPPGSQFVGTDTVIYAGGNGPYHQGRAVRSILKRLVFAGGIQEIEDKSFYGCVSLPRVAFPPSIHTIGSAAFQSCKRLVEVSFAQGLTTIKSSAFQGCISIREVKFPSTLHIIEESAFQSCDCIHDIEIPEGLLEIGIASFAQCRSLSKIRIPSTVKVLGEAAFKECIALEEIDLVGGLTELPEGVFLGCTALNKAKIRCSSLKVIGDYAFSQCRQLGEIKFSEGLITVGCHAFSNCPRLSQVGLPSTVEAVGFSAFSRCPSIVHVKVAMRLKEISSHLFYEGGLYRAETGPNIRVIQSDAFHGCQRLLEVVLANGLTAIGERSFAGCIALRRIAFPETLQEIGRRALSCCRSLSAIRIPSTVAAIRDGAFYKCESLISVEFVSKDRPRIYLGAFDGCRSLCNISVSPGALETGPHTTTSSFGYTKHFRGCALLTKQLQRNKIVSGLSSRFDEFPVHKKCYYSSSTAADDLFLVCWAYSYPLTDFLVDPFGMTPFHVLCSSASCNADLLQVLVDAYPGYILGLKDVRGKYAMDYLNVKLWTSGAKSLMQLCLQVLMIDRVSRWGCTEQLNTISRKVQCILKEDNEDERSGLLHDACKSVEIYERKGRIFQLELALWKSSMIENGDAADRLESRVVSGASVVIPSVLGFLGQSGGNNADDHLSEESASDEDDSSVEIRYASVY